MMMSLKFVHVSPCPLKMKMPQSNQGHAQSIKKVTNQDYAKNDVEQDPKTKMV